MNIVCSGLSPVDGLTAGDEPKTSNIQGLFLWLHSVSAAQRLFRKIAYNHLPAPMPFFDSTAAGRILNPVSVDQNVVDLDIPFRLGGCASTTIQLLGIVGVMPKITWQVLIVPMALACLWIQNYMASSRKLVRLERIQKSPIIYLFAEAIAGASTIRGFGRSLEGTCTCLTVLLVHFFAALLPLNIFACAWRCYPPFVFAFCMAALVSLPHGSIEPSECHAFAE